MKADVVVCYYQQEKEWPLVAWGLQKNAEHIRKVFVVNDEPWGDVRLPVPEGLDVEFLEHPHHGFGYTRSLNQGFRAASADYVLQTTGDQILAPACIERLLGQAQPTQLTSARVVYVGDNVTLDLLEGGRLPVLHGDMRGAPEWLNVFLRHRPWKIARGSALLVPRQGFFEVGGADETFALLGYGSDDHEFGLRWVQKFGLSSVAYVHAATILALGSRGATREDGKRNSTRCPSEDWRNYFAKSFLRHFAYRLALFMGRAVPDEDYDPAKMNVVHTSQLGTAVEPRGDVRADCLRLSWVPDGVCNEIVSFIPLAGFTREEVTEHFKAIARVLSPGAQAVIKPSRWDDSHNTAQLITLLQQAGLGLITEECNYHDLIFVVQKPEDKSSRPLPEKARYHLGCGNISLPGFINVDIRDEEAVDLQADCSNLSWMPLEGATEIRFDHFIEHLFYPQAVALLIQCKERLTPGGILSISFPCFRRAIDAYQKGEAEEVDFLRALFGGTNAIHSAHPEMAHRWGWSVEALSALASRDLGFEVVYAGPEFPQEGVSIGRPWRDGRVILRKPEKA